MIDSAAAKSAVDLVCVRRRNGLASLCAHNAAPIEKRLSALSMGAESVDFRFRFALN